MDYLHVDRSKIVALGRKARGPFITKGLYILASPILCFNQKARHQPTKPKQTLKHYLSHRRFTHCEPVPTQQARLARWWKDQACRWTDRISCGA